jgi:succinate dehydrogenase/fumarate reductase flavoprotein subunit
MMMLETDVLVIGSGAAGMQAVITARQQGSRVILLDRGLIGRAGATVMAQMTVAVAIGEQCPDRWEFHFADTLNAGRGLCDERLARLLCEEGPARIRQMDQWKVGWAREDGHIRQALAPGHDRPRCVYVDFLSTGPAVSRTLRAELNRIDVRRIGDIVVTDIATADGVACGAVGFHLASGEIVAMAAKAVIIATGGLTRLYARNSASANMGGDGFGLALRAGVELIDMEFVQFFPIGHLAPRLIGMDPIMWDPFRYKLGGRLLNADGEEFADRYGQSEAGSYTLTRDVATYAIFKEVEAGRGSPAGGAYLSFTHVPEAELRRAFGPVIDRLARNGIDLTQRPIEVAPIAHYHMGGIRVDASMETGLPGLFAAGEAVGGANGANRLSGNAITEALVFGHVAGAAAAAHAGTNAASPWRDDTAAAALDLLRSGGRDGSRGNLAALVAELQTVMNDKAGPFRTGAKLAAALGDIARLGDAAGREPPPAGRAYDTERLDWFDLRNMLLVAQCVVRAALAREESRGAHQREDFLGLVEDWTVNQTVALDGGRPVLTRRPVVRAAERQVA